MSGDSRPLIAASQDGSFAIAVNANSGIYPVLNALQPETSTVGTIYVAKFSPAGTLLFATYYRSGTEPLRITEDYVYSIQMDRDGGVLLGGKTFSPDGTSRGPAFVMRFSPDGRRVEWTRTVASAAAVQALAVSPTGAVWAAGTTWSSEFRVSPDAYWRDLAFTPDFGYANQAGFLVRLNPRTGEVERSTYLGPAPVSTVYSLRVTPAGAPQLLFAASPPNLIPASVLPGTFFRNVLRLDSEASRATWSGYTDASLASPFDEQFLLLGKSLPVVSDRVEWSGLEFSVDRPTAFLWNPGQPETAAQPVSTLPDPQRVVSHPEDRQKLFALSYGGLYRSENGGLNWDRYHDLSQYSLTQFVIPSWDPSTWLASGWQRTEGVDPRYVLLRSVDSGEQWQELALPDLRREGSLVASPTEAGVLYLLQPRTTGAGGTLLARSDDSGSNWNSVQGFSHEYFTDLLPDPQERGRLLLREYQYGCFMKFCTQTGKNRLWESADGGATFREILAVADGLGGFGGPLFQSPIDPERLYLGRLSSRDHGRTWQSTSTRFVYLVDGSGNLYSWDGNFSPNPYLRSEDDGITWSRLPTPAGLPTAYFTLRPTSLRNQPMFLTVGPPTIAGLALSDSAGVLSQLTLVNSPWTVTLTDAYALSDGRIGALFSAPSWAHQNAGLSPDCQDWQAFHFRAGTLAAGLGPPLLGFCGFTQLAPGPGGSSFFVSQTVSPDRPAAQQTLRITRLGGR